MDDGYIISRLFIVAPELVWKKSLLDAVIDSGIISKQDADAYRKIARDYKKIGTLNNKQLFTRLMGFSPELMSVSTINLMRRFDLIDEQSAHGLRIGLRAVRAMNPVVSNRKITRDDMFNFLDAVARNESVQFFRGADQKKIDEYADFLRQKNYEEYLAQALNDTEFQNLTADEKARRLNRAYRLKPGQMTNINPLTGDDEGLIGPLTRASIDRFRIAASYATFSRAMYSNVKGSIEQSNNVYDAVFMTARGLMTPEILKRAASLGLISKGRWQAYAYTTLAGLDLMSKVKKASEADGMQARMMLVGEGIISHEMLTALRANNMISSDMYNLLKPGVTAVRKAMRGRLPIEPTKIRAIPGENPLEKYKRISGKTDKQLMELLAEAARESGKTAEKLGKADGIGSKIRGKQQRLVQNELHNQMHAYFEGAGSLTIFGEKQAAAAAAQAMQDLQKVMFKSKDAKQLERMLRAQARSGVDSYISRLGNTRDLSARVYKNYKLTNERIDREINKALLRGMNAKDFAKNIEKFISPSVPGGASYAALRLSRTEINNAFHQTSIRYTMEMPWVKGYKWNLSGSHGRPDVCNDMADRDAYNMGQGVFPKSDAPAKPHPHCLCYVTTVDASTKDFERSLRNGSYDKYIDQLNKGGMPGLSDPAETMADGRNLWGNPYIQFAANQAIRFAARKGADILDPDVDAYSEEDLG